MSITISSSSPFAEAENLFQQAAERLRGDGVWRGGTGDACGRRRGSDGGGEKSGVAEAELAPLQRLVDKNFVDYNGPSQSQLAGYCGECIGGQQIRCSGTASAARSQIFFENELFDVTDRGVRGEAVELADAAMFAKKNRRRTESCR